MFVISNQKLSLDFFCKQKKIFNLVYIIDPVDRLNFTKKYAIFFILNTNTNCTVSLLMSLNQNPVKHLNRSETILLAVTLAYNVRCLTWIQLVIFISDHKIKSWSKFKIPELLLG